VEVDEEVGWLAVVRDSEGFAVDGSIVWRFVLLLGRENEEVEMRFLDDRALGGHSKLI
jgi:hypothetical protein